METRSTIAFNFSDLLGAQQVNVRHGPHYVDDAILDDAVFIEQGGATIVIPLDDFDELLTTLQGWAGAAFP